MNKTLRTFNSFRPDSYFIRHHAPTPILWAEIIFKKDKLTVVIVKRKNIAGIPKHAKGTVQLGE